MNEQHQNPLAEGMSMHLDAAEKHHHKAPPGIGLLLVNVSAVDSSLSGVKEMGLSTTWEYAPDEA